MASALPLPAAPTVVHCRGTFLYLPVQTRSSLDPTEARRSAALMYARWLEGGRSSQTELKALVDNLVAQFDILMDLAILATNVSAQPALHAARVCALANAATELTFPVIARPFDADAALFCETLAAAAVVFGARGSSLFTAAAVAKIVNDAAARIQGQHPRDAFTTALMMVSAYWTARAYYEKAVVASPPIEEQGIGELALRQTHVRLASSLLDRNLNEWSDAVFKHAGIDRSAFLRLRKDCSRSDHQLDQRLAYHQIRGLTLSDETRTAPPPLPSSELSLPVVQDGDRYDYDQQFTLEVLRARSDARNSVAAAATATEDKVRKSPTVAEARAHMRTLILGPANEKLLKNVDAHTGKYMELVAARTWLAEQLRIGKVLLDPRSPTEGYYHKLEGFLKAIDERLSAW